MVMSCRQVRVRTNLDWLSMSGPECHFPLTITPREEHNLLGMMDKLGTIHSEEFREAEEEEAEPDRLTMYTARAGVPSTAIMGNAVNVGGGEETGKDNEEAGPSM